MNTINFVKPDYVIYLNRVHQIKFIFALSNFLFIVSIKSYLLSNLIKPN